VAILVTGAGGLLGRAAVRALLQQGVEHVRAVVRDPDQAPGLRRLGARAAVMDAADPDAMEAVLGGVHTAVGLAGSLWTTPEGDAGGDPVAGPWAALTTAAARAGVARLVLVVPPGADPGERNAYLAGCGRAAALVAASGVPAVVLRCPHVLGGSDGLVRHLRGGTAPGPGTQRVAPVLAGDVAAAIAAVDAAAEPPTRLDLGGAEILTMTELAALVRDPPSPTPPPLTATQRDYLARDSVVPPTGWAELGLEPHPVGLDLTVAPGGPLAR
jgi:uncharacterized protein YbjT (DUF2867 family)